jgi:Conserved protein/domain typically associated with flavoprotein oxygenases, DIM6/NTAB family
MDKKILTKLTYGLYIVSSQYDHKTSGCVINTVMQVTNEPLQLSVTLQKTNYTTSLIQKSQRLHIVILDKETPLDTIAHFGFQSGKDKDKFKDIEHHKDIFDIPYPSSNTVASISCQVIKTVDVKTHLIFICDPVKGHMVNEKEVLTYDYYHKKKADASKGKTKWKCDVCGYIYEGDHIPQDYICPICKVDASHFKKEND